MKKIITSVALIFGSLFTPVCAAEINKTVDRTEANNGEEVVYNIEIPLAELFPEVKPTESVASPEVKPTDSVPSPEMKPTELVPSPEVKPTESVASSTTEKTFITIKDEADGYLKIKNETIQLKVEDKVINYDIEAKAHDFTMKVYLADLVHFSKDKSLKVIYTAKIHEKASGDINNKVTISYQDKTVVKNCSIKITKTNNLLKNVCYVAAFFAAVLILIIAYVKK